MLKKHWWKQASEPRLLWFWQNSLDRADLLREIEVAIDRACVYRPLPGESYEP